MERWPTGILTDLLDFYSNIKMYCIFIAALQTEVDGISAKCRMIRSKPSYMKVKKDKVHPCTGNETLYRPYGP
jgi:hypothetical protein